MQSEGSIYAIILLQQERLKLSLTILPSRIIVFSSLSTAGNDQWMMLYAIETLHGAYGQKESFFFPTLGDLHV